jgi:ubiquitin-protein ligase E3 C
VFRSFIYSDIMARQHIDDGMHGHRLQITVHRERIAQDGFDRLRDVDLKGRIGITFIDKFGEEEYASLRLFWSAHWLMDIVI